MHAEFKLTPKFNNKQIQCFFLQCNPIGIDLLLTYDFIHFKIFLVSNGGTAGGAGTGGTIPGSGGAGTGGIIPGTGGAGTGGTGTVPGGGTAATTTAAPSGATTTSKLFPTMLKRDDCYRLDKFLSQFSN